MRLKGHLGVQWADWFEGLTITLAADGDTLLTGPVVDQAALHGLLKRCVIGNAVGSFNRCRQCTPFIPFTRGGNMNTINNTTGKETVRIPVQMKLSALWASSCSCTSMPTSFRYTGPVSWRK